MTNNVEEESFPGVWVRKKKKSRDMSRNTSSSSIDSLYSESSDGHNINHFHQHHQYPQNWQPYQAVHHHHHHHYFPPSTPPYPQDQYLYNQSCNQCPIVPPPPYPPHVHSHIPLQPKPMPQPFLQNTSASTPNRRKQELQNKQDSSPQPNPSQIAIPGTDIPSLTNFTNILLAYMNNTTQPQQNQQEKFNNAPKNNANNINLNEINNNSNIPDNNDTNNNRNNDTTEEANGEDADKTAVDPRKYKTRMCRNWENTGHCPYEHTCCFAHGPDELRDLSSNHKLLASIGYFSNVILLAMTNGQKPALPPHTLYQQPALFKVPHTAEELHACTKTVPTDVRFPYQEPLGAAFRALKKEQKEQREKRKQLATDRSKNKR